MRRILLALVAAAAFTFLAGSAGTADARPYVGFGVGYGPGYGYVPYGGYGYGGYGGSRPYYRPYNYGYGPYVGSYGAYRPSYGGYGYGYRPYYRGSYGRRCW